MTDPKQVTIEVDGQELKASPGAMLIEVTDAAGISIPRFCYHKKLSIAANCRMCLVEVEQGGRPFPKPLPACATPVADGMKVQTRSPKALAAQQGTMEFLLINHPLDCPICDQGGECELQDVAIGYGQDASRYVECKRVVKDPELGPLVATDMTRCIHCTRCVRFGSEIAGIREMGAIGRGEHMSIGTHVAMTLDHELSGNIIDLCPVGALTSKPFRFEARAWELTQSDSIASHDGVGSNIHLHVRRNRLLRVNPRDNEAVNESWISDRDRFSYQGLYTDDRLQRPLIKEHDQWRESDWDEALERVAEKLKDNAGRDASQLGTLISSRSTLEEMYLAQKLTRGLGSANIDCRLRQGGFADNAEPLFPWLGSPITELDTADMVVVIGANLRKDQPLLAHRVRKAAREGAEVVFFNPFELVVAHQVTQIVDNPDGLLHALAGVAKGLGVPEAGVKGLVPGTEATDAQKDLGSRLKDANKAVVLLGNLAAASQEYTVFRGLAHAIATAAGATIGYLPVSANSTGAALAGALPHVLPGAKAADNVGANALEMLGEARRAYLLMGFEPGLDSWNPAASQATLGKADFVVALSPWRSPSLEAVADVILPVGDFAETAGTYVNTEGLWQSFQGAIAAPGDARPAWKVLRVLGNLLDLEGFDYGSARDIREELHSVCAGVTPDNNPRDELIGTLSQTSEGALCRIGDVPIYAVDALVRRAEALQQTADAIAFGVWINPAEAGRLGVANGDTVAVKQADDSVQAVVTLDTSIPEGCARIPAALDGSDRLGASYGPVTLEKV